MKWPIGWEKRTSITHPIKVDWITNPRIIGELGITLCPGKCQPISWSGGWNRDLETDVTRLSGMKVHTIISLIEQKEMEELQVPYLGDVIQKANAVKVPSIDPVIEEASTFTENTDFAAAKTAATNAVFSTSTALPTADAGVYKVSDKSKKISQPSGGVVITKEVTTPDQAVEGDTRKNISSKGFSNRVVTHGDTFLEGPGSGRLGPPSFGYWSTSGDDLIITLNYEPTQILGIQGVVDDSQAEQHFDAASGVTKKVTRFIIGKSTVKGFETSVYQKDDFEVVEGSNGKTIRIKQKYRIYNVNIKVYYKYNDTYDPNYAKA